jgi:predicted HD phosphohydrolase
MTVVSFVHMDKGTKEDYDLLMSRERAHKAAHHVDNVLALLKAAGDLPDSGYQITRFEHSLQSATLAERDGQDEEMIVAALLHDIGDGIAPDNHSEFAASVLRPYVSERTYWIVKHHGIFQGIYFWHHIGWDQHARERYRGHQWFQACADFCAKYDQNAFDPNYDTAPLSHFEPMVRRVLGRAPFAWEMAPAAE